MNKIILILLCLILAPLAASAQEAAAPSEDVKPAFRATEYPLPRFVTLGSNKIFVRAGPGAQYPVKWVFERDGLPVEIVLEFENWRKIKDSQGQEGWVHQSLLSGKRAGIVQGKENVPLRAKPETDAKLTAYMEPGVIAAIEKCEGYWCKVSGGGYSGWIERAALWGVYPDEAIE